MEDRGFDKVFVDPDNNGIMYRCKGCGSTHIINDSWDFNEDKEKPTISPSVLVHSQTKDHPKSNVVRCHHFIKDGNIQYLADCEHDLAGQTIELEYWDQDFDGGDALDAYSDIREFPTVENN